MSDIPRKGSQRAGSSRLRFRAFRYDYVRGRLDDAIEPARRWSQRSPDAGGDDRPSASGTLLGGRWRRYAREYLRWLWPHRASVGLVFTLAVVVAALQMVEPLFIRFIVDRVLLNDTLDVAGRLANLHVAGGVYLLVIVSSALLNVLKDYRQKMLNVQTSSLGREVWPLNPISASWWRNSDGLASSILSDNLLPTAVKALGCRSVGTH